MCFGVLGGCAASCCAGCVCTSLQDCRVQHGPASRLPYLFIMFLCCIFAIVMSLYGEEVLWSNSLLNASFSLCQSSSCQGDGSVYRTSFTLFIFFIIHAILVYFVMAFHWLFFIIKFTCLAAFLFGTFYMPGSIFNGYAAFARIASGFFLVLQIIVLITWALDFNDKVVAKINELQNGDVETETKYTLKAYQCLLIFVTLLLYGSIITGWIFFFQWFFPNSDCTTNQAILAITIVLVIIATILPVVLGTGSIFATGIVSFYMTYLCYAGLSSYPKADCNEWANHRSTASLWIGIIITAGAITYAGFSISNQNLISSSSSGNPEPIELETKVENPPTSGNSNGDTQDGDTDKGINESNYNDVDNDKSVSVMSSDEEKYKNEQRQNILFHLCMAFASVYMCMLYTNWGTNTASTEKAIGRGKISMWVNIVSQWVTFCLYVWTVVAPRVCPERFGRQADE